MDVIKDVESDFTAKFGEMKERVDAIESAIIYYDEFTDAREKYMDDQSEQLYTEFEAIYNAAIEGLEQIYEKTNEQYVLDTRDTIVNEYEETPQPEEPEEPDKEEPKGPDLKPIPVYDEDEDEGNGGKNVWDDIMGLDDSVKILIVGLIIIFILWIVKYIFFSKSK